MEITPLDDMILIEIVPSSEPESPILMPSTADKVPGREGIVRELGPDVKIGVRPGDRVLYGHYSGAPLHTTPEGISYIVTKEEALEAVIG
ncbi:MAG: co-chaperonin GroES (HSP10) [Acidimicrobiales bacterium]|jgi:co-chaperonin GroES (HSP10)